MKALKQILESLVSVYCLSEKTGLPVPPKMTIPKALIAIHKLVPTKVHEREGKRNSQAKKHNRIIDQTHKNFDEEV